MNERPPVRVLIAPNAFKDALDAEEVAVAIESGLLQSRLPCQCRRFPIADGGDGTCRLIARRLQGEIRHHEVTDPLGRRVTASYALIDDGQTAIIELAEASGLRLLAPGEYAPLKTTTRGTGELISAALDLKVKRLILGMGGSATVDGGIGILQALGARLLNSMGNLLEGREDRLELAEVDITAIDSRIFSTEVIILCDVDNPLLGPDGAAAVFGPQKGASGEELVALESFLGTFSKITLKQTHKDISQILHGGTAGGAAAGLWAYLGARLVKGGEFFLQLTAFEAALKDADLVITGEGSIDDQTLLGKGPYQVALAAKLRSLPVIGLAGRVPLQLGKLSDYFDVLMPIGHQPSDLHSSLVLTRQNLERTARQVGDLLALL